MLLSARCEVLWSDEDGSDFLIRSENGSLACAFGSADPAALGSVARDPDLRVILCAPEAAAPAARALPGWGLVAAVLHRLPSGFEPPSSEPAARGAILSRDDARHLSHVPEPLRDEIVDALETSHVAASILEGVPVAFCYPIYETETLWDVSIDTLEPYRRRGLARTCFECLFDHMAAHGKAPVWGTLATNSASLALARRLGFEEVDRSAIFLRAGDRRLAS
jgi:GNAT superfamily N-acetyltransferase